MGIVTNPQTTVIGDGSCCCPPGGVSGSGPVTPPAPRVPTPCCPSGIPAGVNVTINYDPAVNPGVCMPCDGSTFPMAYDPETGQWSTGVVATCDTDALEITLSCVDVGGGAFTWRWSWTYGPGTGGSNVVDEQISCDPLLLIAHGGGTSDCSFTDVTFHE